MFTCLVSIIQPLESFAFSDEAMTIKTQPLKLISTLSEKAMNHMDVGQLIHTMIPSIIETSPVTRLDSGLGISAKDKRTFRYMPCVSR